MYSTFLINKKEFFERQGTMLSVIRLGKTLATVVEVHKIIALNHSTTISGATPPILLA